MPGPTRLLPLAAAAALLLAACGRDVPVSEELALAQTDSGTVQGVAAGDVIAFRGIPYARPPVGALRWRPPQPAAAWSGVRSADAFGPACPQAGRIRQSEDCLTVNVWRPATVSARPRPVMVWIYGGDLAHGNTATYPGGELARQGVVFVSLNYRVGPLGFFAHPALSAEQSGETGGNYGYLDQIAALKWVQRNIAAFGGDPDRVTVYGEPGKGGGAALAHLASPASRGLFQHVILPSPGQATPSAATPPAEAERRGAVYAASLGVTTSGPAALAQLRALPVARLIAGGRDVAVVASPPPPTLVADNRGQTGAEDFAFTGAQATRR